MLALSLSASPARSQEVINGGATVTVPGGKPNPWVIGTDDLMVGFLSEGTLNIAAGGRVENAAGIIAYQAGGTVTVTGDKAEWINSSSLNVGYYGATGTLTIADGGRTESSSGVIGNYGTGNVLVTGEDSIWTVSGTLGEIDIGVFAAGELTIADGGRVESEVAYLGYLGGSSGTATVTGENAVWVNSGALSVGYGNTGFLNIEDGGEVTSASGSIGTNGGSTGTVTVTGDGSKWTVSGNLDAGETGDGTLNIEDGGEVASAYGFIGANTGSSGTVTVTGDGSTWDNTTRLYVGYGGPGTLNIAGGGTVESVDVQLGTSSPGIVHLDGTAGARGVLETGQVGMGAGGGQFIFDGGNLRAAGDWGDLLDGFGAGDVVFDTGGAFIDTNGFNIGTAAELSGLGGLTKIGAGTLTLNGVNIYAGPTTIDDGTLIVGDDSHAGASLASPVTVMNGGMLGGIGTVGATTVDAGGVHVPGGSPGTQTINGDYANHGTLRIEATPAAFDRLIVNGTVDITGATLDLLLSPASASGWAITNGPFTIIVNDGTDAVTGTFGPVTKNLIFLDESLAYAGGDGNDVTLELVRNDVDFADVARTPNQKATGDAIDTLPTGNAVWKAIATQGDEDHVRAAFDALSGEIHASAKSTLMEDSHFLRDAVNERIRAAFGAAPGTDMPVLAYRPGGPRPAAADSFGTVAWGQAFGAWGSFDGNGNAAGMDTSTGGFLTGIDAPLTPNWRLGLVAGYSNSSFEVGERASSGGSDNYHFGLYTGGKWNAWRLTGGLAYTWHDIATNRSAAFAGFSDSLSADYGAGTFQAFGEAGYRIDAGALSLEPFASLAHVSLHSDGFTERGEAAALHVRGQTADTAFTTLGVHLSSAFALGGMKATVHGTLGWRHAFGDATPLSTHAFADSGAFTIAGVPIAQDTAIIKAGLDFGLSANTVVGLSYNGQLAADAREHSFKARVGVRF